ncbi:MAG: DUF1887 family CARF protein [Rikenellaceae bacterium]
MSKTIVCIVEQEMILNYLFIKELCNNEDTVLLISQQKLAPLVAQFKKLFQQTTIDSIILAKDGDEDLWDTICRTIRSRLSRSENYAVNLSGGTRLMSIAVQQVFERFNSQFYFMPIDRNVIIHSQIDDNNDNNDDEIIDIKHRVSIEEYLRINDIKCTYSIPTQPKEYTQSLLTLFTDKLLSNNDYNIIAELSSNNKKFVEYSQVSGLSKFIRYIGFAPEQEGGLTKDEIKYLTGGWYEDCIYHNVKDMISPDDIATGVVIQRKKNHNNDINELDVVFTLNNRLFVIECKTGVGKASKYHDTVYKACALREALLGMRSNAYIFSLNDDPNDRLKITARNMDIVYCDFTFSTQTSKLKDLFKDS